MNSATDWIEKNIQKMMGQISQDARHQRPLPLGITMHGVAYNKFVNILQGMNSFFPEPDGKFKFIGIPVHKNDRIPYGCFTVERFRAGNGMLVK